MLGVVVMATTRMAIDCVSHFSDQAKAFVSNVFYHFVKNQTT